MESGANTEEQAAHRAVGRYVVEFSGLIAYMREFVEEQLGEDRMIAKLAFGEANASQITNSFFAIYERLAELDDEERQVVTRFKTEVNDAIKERNDFAHGDWLIGMEDFPSLWRTKPARKAGPWVATVLPVEEIDARSDALCRLRDHLVEFSWICLGRHPLTLNWGRTVRVRDIFRFQKRRVLRKGRYADEPWFEED